MFLLFNYVAPEYDGQVSVNKIKFHILQVDNYFRVNILSWYNKFQTIFFFIYNMFFMEYKISSE